MAINGTTPDPPPWDDVIFRDELAALDARHDGFHGVLAVTRAPPQRAGDYGHRVNGAMVREVIARLGGPPAQVFVCGRTPSSTRPPTRRWKSASPARSSGLNAMARETDGTPSCATVSACRYQYRCALPDVS
jgi:hypothetical protein